MKKDSDWSNKCYSLFDEEEATEIEMNSQTDNAMEEMSEEIRLKYEELPEINSERWMSLEDLPGEHWKDCVGFEGKYAVSDYGRVKRLGYTNTVCSSRTKEFTSTIKENIKSLIITPDEYISVHLFTSERKNKMMRVHRLVAQAFIPNPDNYPVVDHISTNRQENVVENLRWCTQEENSRNNTSYNKISERVKEWHKNRECSQNPPTYKIEQSIIYNASTEDIFTDYYPDNDRIYVNVDFKDEIWKTVPDTDEQYEVSNYGRVRSNVKKEPRIMKQCKNRNGYYKVSINNGTKTYAVHILVMKTFHGIPDDYQVIEHINNIKTDNRLSNLCYSSYLQNSNNELTVAINNTNRDNATVKKRIVQYDIDGNYIADFDSCAQASEILNINKDSIYRSCMRQSLENGQYQFRYEDEVDSKYDKINAYTSGTFVNQYDIYGKFIKKYRTVADAECEFGTKRGTISKVCGVEGRTYSCGYQWKYSDEYDNSDIEAYDIINSNILLDLGIDQYELDGTFIKHWDKLKHIENELGYYGKFVQHCCRHKRYEFKGYQWIATLESEYVVKDVRRQLNPTILINQYGLDGTFIKQYSSIDEICDENDYNKPKFKQVFSETDVFVAHYYQWKVVNDVNDNENIAKDKNYVEKETPKVYKPVSQYKEDGTFVAEYSSTREASEIFNINPSNIINCCDGKARTACGYCWFYSDAEDKTIKEAPVLKKVVYQYSKDGEFIKEWSDVDTAAKELFDKKNGSSIAACCSGHDKQAYGFQWCYPENADKMKPIEYVKLSKKIRQYTLDGEFVAEFEDIEDAVSKNGGAYQGYGRCCRRERPKYLGHIWRYEKDDEFAK